MPDTNAFFTQVLSGMGLAPSPWRLAFFAEWTAFESGHGEWAADWNPLNTTLHMPGDRDLGNDPNQNNGNPVREYPNMATGITATTRTLLNGYYPLIVRSLAEERIVPGIGANIRTWGTGSFADHIEGGWSPSVAPSTPAPAAPSLEARLARLENIVAAFGARSKDGKVLTGEAALADQAARGNSLALGLALYGDTLQQLAFIIASRESGASPEQVIAALQVIITRATAAPTK